MNHGLDTHSRLIELLESKGMPYRLSEHEDVTTSAAAAKARGVDLSTGAKALVVNADGTLVLAVVSASRKVDMEALKAILQAERVGLASIAEAESATGLPKGAIPAIGAVMGLQTYIDESVLDNDLIRFNAASRGHSVEMRASDLPAATDGIIGKFSA